MTDTTIRDLQQPLDIKPPDFTPEEIQQKLLEALKESEKEKDQLLRDLEELSKAVSAINTPETVIREKKGFSLPNINLGGNTPAICGTICFLAWVVSQSFPSAQMVALSNRMADNVDSISKVQPTNKTSLCISFVCPEKPTENAVDTHQPIKTTTVQETAPTPAQAPPGITTVQVKQNANLRSSPGVDSAVLFTIPGGDRVIPIQHYGDWTSVQWVQPDGSMPNGYKVLSTGYIASALIQ